jgi:Family of unknown function (DUF6328)
MVELLQEIRVAQTGTQILFAFLLGVPFTQRFAEVTSFQRNVYFVTLLAAALASLFLIAPTAYHRILFRQKEKAFVIDASHVLVLAGLAFVALAMTGVILLITDLLYSDRATAIVTGTTAGLFVVLWFVIPIRRRIRD